MRHANLLLFLFLLSLLNGYEIGRGLSIVENETQSIKLAGHFSAQTHHLHDNSASIDTIGVILYGDITNTTHYLIEYGSENTIFYDDNNIDISSPIIRNRLYLKQSLGSYLDIKVGQFLTPIGIWNPTYIPALRDSLSTPYVADDFFPKIITGVGLYLHNNDHLKLNLFYHTDKESDPNLNNIRAHDFFGGELVYELGFLGHIALPFGHYKSFSSRDDSDFLGFNFLLPMDENHEISSEYLFMDKKWGVRSWVVQAGYLQYLYHYSDTSAPYLRVGAKNHRHKFQDDNLIFGLRYTPLDATALKIEFRHRSLRYDEKRIENSLNIGYSVLF